MLYAGQAASRSRSSSGWALFGVEGWIVAAPFINTSRLQQKRQQLSFFKSHLH